MTLIELICAYALCIKENGRRQANRLLVCTDPLLVKHIKASVDNKGNFINAFGRTFKAEDYT
jgi:hypothetical protein